MRCGAVEEFRDERLESITVLAAESRGFVRHRHRLVIYGLCRACQREAAAAEFHSEDGMAQ